jgi:hypothetical protein
MNFTVNSRRKFFTSRLCTELRQAQTNPDYFLLGGFNWKPCVCEGMCILRLPNNQCQCKGLKPHMTLLLLLIKRFRLLECKSVKFHKSSCCFQHTFGFPRRKVWRTDTISSLFRICSRIAQLTMRNGIEIRNWIFITQELRILGKITMCF